MSVRVEPAPRRGPTLGRAASLLLERALDGLEGGALEVELPSGATRRFGAGAAVRLTIHDAAFFRRLATRGKLGLGESYTAGEWDTDDLVGLFELLVRNADLLLKGAKPTPPLGILASSASLALYHCRYMSATWCGPYRFQSSRVHLRLPLMRDGSTIRARRKDGL